MTKRLGSFLLLLIVSGLSAGFAPNLAFAAPLNQEDEAQKTLLRFTDFQKSYYKKNKRYAFDMIELIGSLKSKSQGKIPTKPTEPILNSQFVIAYSPACVLSNPAARKAKKLLLWYPELPDEKRSIIKLSKNLTNNFEFLIKKKVKDLPKGKCLGPAKGFELYAIGFKSESKTALIWSIDQDLKFKKLR